MCRTSRLEPERGRLRNSPSARTDEDAQPGSSCSVSINKREAKCLADCLRAALQGGARRLVPREGPGGGPRSILNKRAAMAVPLPYSLTPKGVARGGVQRGVGVVGFHF